MGAFPVSRMAQNLITSLLKRDLGLGTDWDNWPFPGSSSAIGTQALRLESLPSMEIQMGLVTTLLAG